MKSRIPQIASKLDETVYAAAEEALRPVVEEAQARVPVDSGALRDAIHVERYDDDTVAVVAGDTTAWYGHIVEGGGAKTSPHPFLVPAFEAHKKQVAHDIGLAVKRLTETGKGNV